MGGVSFWCTPPQTTTFLDVDPYLAIGVGGKLLLVPYLSSNDFKVLKIRNIAEYKQTGARRSLKVAEAQCVEKKNCILKSDNMTDRPTDHPTDRPTNGRT